MQGLNSKWTAGILVFFLFLLTGCQGNAVPGKEATIAAEEGIIVIGAGAAGLAASIEAAQAGSKVLLLEKLPMVGGSMLCSGGTIYAAQSPVQLREGITDSAEALADFWLQEAQGPVDADIIRLVAQHSGETIGWLEVGVEFAPCARRYLPIAGPIGLWRKGAGLANLGKGSQGCRCGNIVETRAQALLTDDGGAVVGVRRWAKMGKEFPLGPGLLCWPPGVLTAMRSCWPNTPPPPSPYPLTLGGWAMWGMAS